MRLWEIVYYHHNRTVRERERGEYEGKGKLIISLWLGPPLRVGERASGAGVEVECRREEAVVVEEESEGEEVEEWDECATAVITVGYSSLDAETIEVVKNLARRFIYYIMLQYITKPDGIRLNVAEVLRFFRRVREVVGGKLTAHVSFYKWLIAVAEVV